MRYTEARLTPIAKIMLDELGQGTVDWQPNFDGTLKEPKLLPPEYPRFYLTGLRVLPSAWRQIYPPIICGSG